MSLQHYGLPLVITDSGGKDSQVCKELALMAGIPFEIMHNHTTADAPETVRFVRQEAKRFEELGIQYTINMPTYKGQRVSMWSLIPQKLMPPTRLVRYCCSVLKETGGAGRFITTGVRWAESTNRKNSRGIYEKSSQDKERRIILNNDNDDKRMLFENCRLKAKRVVNPIVDWKDDDVWQFLEDAKAPVNPLYAEGWCRVGCVGCPMAGTKGREQEFSRWPKYKGLYLLAFRNLLTERSNRGMFVDWQTPEDVFNWWMEYDIMPGQMDIFDLVEEE
ncbi:MAG: phosphoadenosine phosphosulfate reductase family protein [Oscillospiraceae bacterium]|nr:phosphoadenosine phosphosulfate reductase family protein [Oscillospiraceae bacterium]